VHLGLHAVFYPMTQGNIAIHTRSHATFKQHLCSCYDAMACGMLPRFEVVCTIKLVHVMNCTCKASCWVGCVTDTTRIHLCSVHPKHCVLQEKYYVMYCCAHLVLVMWSICSHGVRHTVQDGDPHEHVTIVTQSKFPERCQLELET
jgi:hypothetical protein